MDGATLRDYDLIYPRNGMWTKLRLPPFSSASSVLVDAEPENERSLAEALDIISLIEKDDGTRRSIDGVNRAAQRRWSERRIYIDLVYELLMAWQMAGADAVAALVAAGKREFDGRIVFQEEPKNLVRDMVAILRAPKIGSELFVAISTLVRMGKNATLEPKIYLVTVAARFGEYRFYLASLEAPEPEDVRPYCCWQTRVSPGES
jgi:hypothetical protein